jgi:hypothetical protein
VLFLCFSEPRFLPSFPLVGLQLPLTFGVMLLLYWCHCGLLLML